MQISLRSIQISEQKTSETISSFSPRLFLAGSRKIVEIFCIWKPATLCPSTWKWICKIVRGSGWREGGGVDWMWLCQMHCLLPFVSIVRSPFIISLFLSHRNQITLGWLNFEELVKKERKKKEIVQIRLVI
jgi:hypothetical protein